MSWTAPFTAISGTPYTAAQFNGFRDAMLETEVSRAQTVGGYCVTTGMNQLAERIPNAATVVTLDTTSSTTFTDLDGTNGPSVPVVTGTMAWVSYYGSVQNSSVIAAFMGYRIDGATALDPSDSSSFQLTNANAGTGQRAGVTILQTGLTPGLNTFTLQYRVSGGVGTFAARSLTVFPF